MKTQWRFALVTFILVVLHAGMAWAHPCPYEWNKVRLKENLVFTKARLSEVIAKLNAVVKEQTKGKIQRVAILDTTPAKIIKVTDDDDLMGHMNTLVNEYHRQQPSLIAESDSRPFSVTFRKDSPLACRLWYIANLTDMIHEENERGSIFRYAPEMLECRAYRITDALLKRVEEEKKRGLPSNYVPIYTVFGWFSVYGGPDRGIGGSPNYKSLYIPEKRVILIIDDPEGHSSRKRNLVRFGFFNDKKDRTTSGASISVVAAKTILNGDKSDMTVTITNNRPKQPLHISYIEIEDTYSRRFNIRSVNPKTCLAHIYAYGDYTAFKYDITVPAGTSQEFVFRLSARTPGVHKGNIDVFESDTFLRATVNTTVKKKDEWPNKRIQRTRNTRR